MRDPWESDAPSQKLQTELTRTVIESEDLPDAPSRSVAKPKQQSMAPFKKELGATGRKHQQPEIFTTAPQIATNPTAIESLLQLNRENLIQGVIWAEILGKPKAKRGRR
jgi:hypothetical protein